MKPSQKFAQHNERVREYLQQAFAYEILTAARDWKRAGKPETEWCELYEFVIADAAHA